MASLTVYPDPDPETTSVDGGVWRGGVSEVWGTITAGAGVSQDTVAVSQACVYFQATATADQWSQVRRGVFLFDTSPLGNLASISSAVLSLRGTAKFNGISSSPVFKLYTSNPASNTNLVGGTDFQSFGSTPLSTGVSYAGWVTTDYNAFTLNASGLLNVHRTGVSKFGIRDETYDVLQAVAPWVSNSSMSVSCNYADNAGTTADPKLVIEYTTVSALSLSRRRRS